MNQVTPFIGFWMVNSVLLYAANQFLPENFVLGNAQLSPIIGAVVAGIVITLLVALGTAAKMMLNKIIPALEGVILTLIYFFLVNFVVIWITARLAEQTGLGISSFIYVAGLALVADILQWAVWAMLGPKDSVAEPSEDQTDDEENEEEEEEDEEENEEEDEDEEDED